MRLRVDAVVKGGFGLGRGDAGVMLVSGALPGELVEARVLGRRGGVPMARCQSILEPSVDRRAAPCPIYSRCGGCDLQHARYLAQLALKQRILEDCLYRIGKISALPAVASVGSPEMGWRRRVRLHPGRAAGRATLGFYRRASRQVEPLPAEGCPLLTEGLRSLVTSVLADEQGLLSSVEELTLLEGDDGFSALARVPGHARAQRAGFERWLSPLGVVDLALAGEEDPLTPRQEGVAIAVGSHRVRASARCFFQGNAPLLSELCDRVLAAMPERCSRLWDLHAGVGLFARKASERARETWVVEMDGQAMPLLRSNVAGPRVRVFEGTDVAFLRRGEPAPDFCILDPPRTGLSREARDQLVRIGPRRIALVGCDPAAFATDLGTFVRASYRVTTLTLLDLFPQSSHVEAVAQIERA